MIWQIIRTGIELKQSADKLNLTNEERRQMI